MYKNISIKDIELKTDLIRQKKAEHVPKQSDEYIRDSIKNVGIKEPLTVLKLGERYLLVDGYRRYKAILDLNSIGELPETVDLNSLPAIVHDAGSPEVLRYMLDIRQDLPYSLQAKYIKILIEDHGKTKKKIAQLYGVSPPSIENWLVILKCTIDVQKAIDKGQFPMSAGKIFSTLKEEGQNKLFKRLKNYTRVTRDRINREANRIPKNLFNIPDKEKRREIAKSLINTKTGYVHDNRTELKVRKKAVMDDIVIAEKERAYLEKEVKFYYDSIRDHVNIVEIWLRTEIVKNYIASNYPKIFSDIRDILYIELGKKI